MIGKQGAIGISIKTNSQFGFARHYLPGHNFRVKCATIPIDITAIGRVVDKLGMDAAPVKNFGGNVAGRSVGAIYHHAKVSRPFESTGKPLDISIVQVRGSCEWV